MYADGVIHKGQGYLEATEAHYERVLEKKDIFDVYDVEPSPFARGKFGTVKRVVHKKTGVKYAAKFLRRRRRDQCLSKDINHEIAVLMLCKDSKHIINLFAVHETRLELALILELAHGGELQLLLDMEGCLTESQTIYCLNEILKALQFMHQNNIAHLDVKPQNILMNGERIEDGLKLCDFGISRVINKACEVREIVGTPDYVAPEILQYDPVSLKTDIWSVGVLAYVLLSGCSPFAGDTKQETFLNISKCHLTFPADLFEEVSQDAIDFISDTLQIKPRERLDVNECLDHKWLLQAPNTVFSAIATDEEVHITSEADLNAVVHKISTSNIEVNLMPDTCESGNEIITSSSPNGKVTCTVLNTSANILVDNGCGYETVVDDVNSENHKLSKEDGIGGSNNNNRHEDSSVTMNVTISLVNRTISTSSVADVTSDSAITATINGSTVTPISSVSSTCTIGKNGLIVEELDEKSATPAQLVEGSSLQESPKSVVMISPHHEMAAALTTAEEIDYSNRNHNRSSNGDNKENHHCTLLAMNGYHNGHHHNHSHHHLHQNGGTAADQLFPDAPTTPKVLRKVAPMYCTFKSSSNGSSSGGIKRVSSSSVTSSATSTEDSVLETDESSEATNPNSSSTSGNGSSNGSVTVTLTVNGDDRHASTTRIHICPPD